MILPANGGFTMRALLSGILAIGVLAGSPAFADTPEQLDARSRAIEDPQAGVAFARREIRAGDLLGALATLEGVMLYHPQDAEARLFHAGLLCRLDDPQGSVVEFEDIQGEKFSDAIWADAASACDDAPGGR